MFIVTYKVHNHLINFMMHYKNNFKVARSRNLYHHGLECEMQMIPGYMPQAHLFQSGHLQIYSRLLMPYSFLLLNINALEMLRKQNVLSRSLNRILPTVCIQTLKALKVKMSNLTNMLKCGCTALPSQVTNEI